MQESIQLTRRNAFRRFYTPYNHYNANRMLKQCYAALLQRQIKDLATNFRKKTGENLPIAIQMSVGHHSFRTNE